MQLKGAVSSKLTPREIIIVSMLCGECLTSREIAAHLNLSYKTVETHRANIFRKRSVHSMAELCREYWRRFYEVQ